MTTHGSGRSFTGKKITVVGLGIEGVSLVKYLARHGADITVSDARTESELAQRLNEIAGLPVQLSLGANDPSAVEGADILFVSQGVPLDVPAVLTAKARNIPISSVTDLFVKNWPGPIAAITGSAGKTTTTSMVDAMFTAAGRDHLLVGNIGSWPLDQLDANNDGRWAVMEISHTQLQLAQFRPTIACITNITPNHLDRFTWAEYVELKRNLIRWQLPEDWTVLNFDDPEGWNARTSTNGHIYPFSRRSEPEGPASYLSDETAWTRLSGSPERIFQVSDLKLRGKHNLENALAAASVARLAGLPSEAIEQAVKQFRGVAHRLELVAEFGGVAYYNDSIATAPERTIAGMRSFDEPLVLLLGGRDKHLPLDELAQECYRRCRAVVLFGEAGELFEAAFTSNRPAGSSLPVKRVKSLEQAIVAAGSFSQAGDIVLLSPACTSFDAYQNFEERGAHFRSLVNSMNSEAAPRTKEFV